MSRLERVRLAPGLSIAPVVTGLWQIADMERRRGGPVDPDRAAAAMARYVEAGLTSFDMADHYGSAEKVVGRYLASGGERIEILTKWVPPPGPVSAEAARQAVERALERLGTERIDLLQFHAWRYCDPAYLDALSALCELRDEGLVGHLGLTNFDAAHLDLVLASGIDVVSNQVSFSLLDRRAAGAMSGVCRRRGVGLLAYGTVAGGLLTERHLGAADPTVEDLATWSERKYRRFVEALGGWEALQEVLATLATVAARRGVSVPQLAVRYVLDQPAVAAVIIGARLGESEHVAETTALLDLELDAEARAEIDAVLAKLGVLPGDCGDEYRRPPFLTAAGDLSHHFEEAPPPYEVEESPDGRRRVLSGTAWEDLAGYCRALRVGRRILISGTTATHGARLVGGADPAAQMRFAIDKIEGALVSLGGRLEDVVRTRVFVQEAADWEAVAKVHGERFAGIRPVNTLVEARLIGPEYRVEMEAEALVEEAAPAIRAGRADGDSTS